MFITQCFTLYYAILGKALRIFISFHFPDSRLSVLNGLHFQFLSRDSKNQQLIIRIYWAYFLEKWGNKPG